MGIVAENCIVAEMRRNPPPHRGRQLSNGNRRMAIKPGPLTIEHGVSPQAPM